MENIWSTLYGYSYGKGIKKGGLWDEINFQLEFQTSPNIDRSRR